MKNLKSPLLDLPTDLYARHTELVLILRELDETISVIGLLGSLLKVLVGRGKTKDYQTIFYGAYCKESKRVRELIFGGMR